MYSKNCVYYYTYDAMIILKVCAFNVNKAFANIHQNINPMLESAYKLIGSPTYLHRFDLKKINCENEVKKIN